jgi:hypothetical protein
MREERAGPKHEETCQECKDEGEESIEIGWTEIFYSTNERRTTLEGKKIQDERNNYNDIDQ